MSFYKEIDLKHIKDTFSAKLKYAIAADQENASTHSQFLALALTIRDRLIDLWFETQHKFHTGKVKRVYYLSLEYLLGRTMENNCINLGIQDLISKGLSELGYSFAELEAIEVDAGLGNGGLGRLAACFIESMATLGIPSIGYGLRYDYGIFRQEIVNGYQVEHPDDWLRNGNPWEIERSEIQIPVHFGGRVEVKLQEDSRIYEWVDTETVIALAYDTLIVGYGAKTVNTLRLWSARAAEEFNLHNFNEGEYEASVEDMIQAGNLTRVLYPNDKIYLGKELRLKQQYFFVAASLADIINRFKAQYSQWKEFPNKASIQLNDTHPSIAVVELMRILLDKEQLNWGSAWQITVSTFAYTNHTLMPEALEKWPVDMFERLLPRHLQIIYEINKQFLELISQKFPQFSHKIADISIIEEGNPKMIRMAFIAIIGSHSINGVADLHSKLLQMRLVPLFAKIWPERFNNKTNGISHRRFILQANPELSQLLTAELGDAWITNLTELNRLKVKSGDLGLQKKIAEIKRSAKEKLITFLKNDGYSGLDPNGIFDIQIKRIHEYKRQLLNVLHIVMLYISIRAKLQLHMKTDRHTNTSNLQNATVGAIQAELIPRYFIFAGKAAPGYEMAKLIIKLINNVSTVINKDPEVNKYLRVYFLSNYRVSLAELLIPAADISEQISTAGTEASGTGNMKFMANGAITIGTLDGANIEILEEVGSENIFIFGHNAQEIAELRPKYNPKDYLQDSEIHSALELLFGGYFDCNEKGVFEPIRRALLEDGDYYMHLADLRSYADAHTLAYSTYTNKEKWYNMAIQNIASCGKFSSDRAIQEYAREIWNV